MRPVLPLLIALSFITHGCRSSDGQTSGAPPVQTNATAKTAATPSVQVSGERIRGKVLKTMDVGGYTYALIEIKPGASVWAAGPKEVLAAGSSVDIGKGMEMQDFTSKSLNKTFNYIYFVASFGGEPVVGDSKTAPTSMPSSQPSSMPTSKPSSSAEKVAKIAPKTVKKAAGGHTIAETFAKATELAGKSVSVSGRVVKFNAGIMGKNWIHLQDGTGNPAANTHDLTVTTDGVAAVGDEVVITGVLTKDKDFGAGYSYPVIIEDAKVAPR